MLLVCLTAISASGSDEDGWKKSNETDDGIIIFSRNLQDSGIRELKAVCIMEAHPKYIWQAVLDKDTYKDSSKYVLIDRVFKTDDENIWYNYQLVAPPFLSRRDCTIRYQSYKDADTLHYRLVWRAAGDFGPPPEKGVIRLTVCDGSFLIEPRDGGRRSLITYWICVDPGGSVPAWAANLANRSSLPDFLRKVRKQSITIRDRENASGGR